MEHTGSNNRKFRSISIILGILIVFTAGVLLGGQQHVRGFVDTKIFNKTSQVEDQKTTEQKSDHDLVKFWNAWKLLDEKYPFVDKIPTTDDKIYGAIAGLASSYKDPYTMFFPPQQAKLFSDEIKGQFGGVGMEVGTRDGLIVVIAPLKGSPAEKAGIIAGDILLSIDEHIIEDTNISQVVSWIRGAEGSAVTIKIMRKGSVDPIIKTITRSKIEIPILDTQIKSDTFVISFYSFSENSAKAFERALQEFALSGKTKLLIDLRNNPGGYLESAVDIASMILPEGSIIVKEDNGSGSAPKLYYSYGYGIVPPNVTIGVLLNRGSASASEILAGALQDNKRATIYGEKSFGKGSVQELIPLDDGSSLKITIAKWLTPDNHSISEKGITPTTLLNTRDFVSTKKTPDPLLDKVVSLMKK